MSKSLVFSNLVKNTIKELNKKQMKAVIIAWGGSYSLGLQNRTSDIDLYAVIQNDKMEEVPAYYSFYDCDVQQQVDVMCVSMDAVLQEIENYNKTTHLYPTYIFREKKLGTSQMKDMQREDFKRGMIFRTILTDYVWTKDEIGKYFSVFQGILKRQVLLDFYFTRAIGNYVNFIADKEQIAVRKYLYTLHEIWYCQWIISKDTIPPINFMKLKNSVLNDIDNLKGKIQELLNRNHDTSLTKDMLFVNSDQEINKYIKEKLTWIEKELPSIRSSYQCKDLKN